MRTKAAEKSAEHLKLESREQSLMFLINNISNLCLSGDADRGHVSYVSPSRKSKSNNKKVGRLSNMTDVLISHKADSAS